MRRLALFCLKLYQNFPPIFPVQCRYMPSCSEYAKEAFMRYSFFKALGLTCWRIARCHPFSRGGFDPVK